MTDLSGYTLVRPASAPPARPTDAALAAFNERRTTARLAREDQKRARLEHFRQVDQAARTAQYRPTAPAAAAKPTRQGAARKATASRPRPAPRPTRASAPLIRPCVTCEHPTRPNRVKAAAAPDTRPRLHAGECTTCGTRADRTPSTRASGGQRVQADTAAMVAMYATGAGSTLVARQFGVSPNTVLRYARAAGVTTRRGAS